ncbi:CLUMA_CG009396, isoform B [Clunio marinus]|uniref:CLUMA_CG009396, isoform B n=1 Tax=Clunio marinus TaxID=568069 RepID=A0A1J1IBY9_9DIPT|nr:CLUMA_CG009396, isoform B [Clunio marinus]
MNTTLHYYSLSKHDNKGKTREEPWKSLVKSLLILDSHVGFYFLKDSKFVSKLFDCFISVGMSWETLEI